MASYIVMYIEFQCYSIEKYKYYISFFFSFEKEILIAQAALAPTMKLKLALNPKTSCLPLLSTRILGLCDYTQLYLF